MTTQTQSTLEIYSSILSKFNLHCRIASYNDRHLQILDDNHLLILVNLDSGSILSYDSIEMPAERLAPIKKELTQVEQEKTADNLAWEEARNRASATIQKAEKVEQKTTEQLQADEFNKFSKLAQNSKGIEFTINLTTNSLAYRLSVKLQNPRTGNKITVYQFRNSSTIGLTTIYFDKFSEPLRQYNLKHTAELQHIFSACIEKLATRDRV